MTRNFINICLVNLLIMLVACSSSARSRYPETKEEKTLKEMGSMTGGYHLNLTPGPAQNQTTKSSKSQSVNQYLWQSVLEILSFTPLSSTDSTSGMIITDWYSPKSQQQCSFKVQVLIKADIISLEAIEVKIFKRLKDQYWQVEQSLSLLLLRSIIEEIIIRRARDLYIQSNPVK